MEKKEYQEEVRKLINQYLREISKTISRVKKEWKEEQEEAKKFRLKVIYPRIYSNQYYSYVKLIRFFKDLKAIK